MDLEMMKGWVGIVGWPAADGLPTWLVTRQMQVERRTGIQGSPPDLSLLATIPLSAALSGLKSVHNISSSYSVGERIDTVNATCRLITAVKWSDGRRLNFRSSFMCTCMHSAFALWPFTLIIIIILDCRSSR